MALGLRATSMGLACSYDEHVAKQNQAHCVFASEEQATCLGVIELINIILMLKHWIPLRFQMTGSRFCAGGMCYH